jgi:hypothetical protein
MIPQHDPTTWVVSKVMNMKRLESVRVSSQHLSDPEVSKAKEGSTRRCLLICPSHLKGTFDVLSHAGCRNLFCSGSFLWNKVCSICCQKNLSLALVTTAPISPPGKSQQTHGCKCSVLCAKRNSQHQRHKTKAVIFFLSNDFEATL